MAGARSTCAAVRTAWSTMRPVSVLTRLSSRTRVSNSTAVGALLMERRSFASSTVMRAATEFTGMSEQGLTESQVDVRRAIFDVCAQFGDDYWMEKDQ